MDLEPQFNVFPCQNITSAQGHTPALSFSASFVRWAKLQFLFFPGWVGWKPLVSYAWIYSPSSSKHLMYYWRPSTEPVQQVLSILKIYKFVLLLLCLIKHRHPSQNRISSIRLLFIQRDANVFLCLCILNGVLHPCWSFLVSFVYFFYWAQTPVQIGDHALFVVFKPLQTWL